MICVQKYIIRERRNLFFIDKMVPIDMGPQGPTLGFSVGKKG